MTQLNSLTDLIPERQDQQTTNSGISGIPEGDREWRLNPDTGHLEVTVTPPASAENIDFTIALDDTSLITLVADRTILPSTTESMFRLNGINEDQTEWSINIETSGNIVFNNIGPRGAAVEFWNCVQDLVRNSNVRV